MTHEGFSTNENAICARIYLTIWASFAFIWKDFYDDFFQSSSSRDAGTLFNIRDNFGHREVSTKVSTCINKAQDLLQFTTDDLVCLLAMKVPGMQDLSDVPHNFPTDLSQFQKYLVATCTDVLKALWPDIDHASMTENGPSQTVEKEKSASEATQGAHERLIPGDLPAEPEQVMCICHGKGS